MDNVNSNCKKILIVEDDQFLRDFYRDLLSSEGFTVEVAVDGEDGAAKLQDGGNDLTLLDIMLPKKDGLTLLREMKANPPKSPNGPVIILTNLGSEDTINQAFSSGASGYLIKSALNPDQVLSEIHNFLKI